MIIEKTKMYNKIQEDKELLLVDICARLPYGVKITWNEKHWVTVTPSMYSFICEEQEFTWKPYLRPMSSMTEEEKEEYNKVMFQSERYENDYAADIDWLNAHHFDYRGLIPKGLALEAPEGMYNNKEEQQ